MKNRLFLLCVLLTAFTLLYAEKSSKARPKKIEVSTRAGEETIHPLIIPGSI